MDRISQLSDALLLQILSFVPTKDVVATCVLSKRWQSLWKMVPKLKCEYMDHDIRYGTFVEFVYRSLLLRKAAVLDTLHLTLDSSCAAVDIEIWVGIAADCCVRELDIDFSYEGRPMRLPRSLYTCEKLVVMKLQNASLVDVPPIASFRFLKTLHLLYMIYSGDESVPRLLSSCPILEDLVIKRWPNDNVVTFTIKAASLRSLSIDDTSNGSGGHHRFVIDAPFLKFMSIVYYGNGNGICLIENAPKMEEAVVIYRRTAHFLGSLTSVKRLRLCLFTSNDPYPTGTIFSKLVHLEICTCGEKWWNLVARVLEDSPKLRVLKLIRSQNHGARTRNPDVCWSRPNSVPECLLLHLETFEWKRYEGTRVEKDLVTYILMNSCRLNVATLSLESFIKLKDKVRMLKELASVPRASTACRLLID